MGLRGSPADLREFERRLKLMPQYRTANKIAKTAAVVLTELAGRSYDSRETVFGDARQHSKKEKGRKAKKKRKYLGRKPGGKRKGPTSLTLLKSGTVRGTIKFVVKGGEGTTIRAHLGTPYAKYLIGKYKIMPCGNSAMPFQWREALDEISKRVFSGVFDGSVS